MTPPAKSDGFKPETLDSDSFVAFDHAAAGQ